MKRLTDEELREMAHAAYLFKSITSDQIKYVVKELQERRATERESGSGYKAAYEAYHFYVHASEAELLERNMTRADALNEANLADIKLSINTHVEDERSK